MNFLYNNISPKFCVSSRTNMFSQLANPTNTFSVADKKTREQKRRALKKAAKAQAVQAQAVQETKKAEACTG